MSRTIIAPLVAAALVLSACGGDDEDAERAATTAAEQAATVPAETQTQPQEDPGPGNIDCEQVEGADVKGEQQLEAPRRTLDKSKRHAIVFETSCGDIEIALDVKRAPKTTASVAALVRRGFYDGLGFHRIGRGPGGEDFVIQGGDPLGDGQGGPGYSVVEAPPQSLRYTRGVVAMAKTQIEEPGTSGSQFYIVTADDAGLPPEYALLGRVTKGLDVVARIASVRADPQTEQPTEPVVIKRARLVTR